MTATRDLPTGAGVKGAEYLQQVSDAFKAISNYVLGNAINPTGTNAYSFDIDVNEGISAAADGMEISILIPNTNTASVTFEISNVLGIGVKAAVRQDGADFIGGELLQGIAYSFKFFSTENEWRLQSPQSSSVEIIQTSKTVFAFLEEYNQPGSYTWTAPHRCNVRLNAIGGGGSGAHGNTNGGGGGGGGASGRAIKYSEVASGQQITIIVGGGGQSSGASGTDTTLTTTGIFISASGGGGGNGGTGGGGGQASGGDQNYTGGNGGTIQSSTNGGGGGSVGINNSGISVSSNTTNGAGLKSGNNPRFLVSSPAPFDLIGAVGGINSNVFCGGDGSSNDTPGNQGGTGAGGGGGSGTSFSAATIGGNGGDGVAIIEYTMDLDL